MDTQISNLTAMPNIETKTTRRNWLYTLAGIAALTAMLVNLSDIVLGFGSSEAATYGFKSAAEWFAISQQSAFKGLYALGIFNIAYMLAMLPVYFALLWAHRNRHAVQAALVVAVFLLATAIYISTNAAIPMMVLAEKYVLAQAALQKTMFVSAGEAILARGEDFTPGSFPGMILSGCAAIAISYIMLRGGIFGKRNAWIGLKTLPTDVVIKVKKAIRDVIGVMIAAHQDRAVKAVRKMAAGRGGKKESTLFGTGIKLPCEIAALVNGTMATTLDMDDGSMGLPGHPRFHRGHPGGMVIPSALAMAEREGTDGRGFIEAVVAGYEVELATAWTIGESVLAGRTGTYGAATASAKLLRLDREQMLHTLRIAEAQCPSPTYAFIWNKTDMTKEAPGWAAMLLENDQPKSVASGAGGNAGKRPL